MTRQSSWRTNLPWPLAVIDFEASSLDQDDYPIEVGLALWPAPDDPVFSWSTLIQPAGAWSRLGHWSPKSAKVHGIRGRDLLAMGQPVGLVAAALNNVLGAGATAWCDGDAYDAHWTATLFKAVAQHRAREDAEQLLFTLAHAVGAKFGPVQDLARSQPALAALAGSTGTPAD